MLEIFYEQNKDRLIAVLSSYSRDNEAAADAVQDAFLKALKNRTLASAMQEKSLWSWLYTTAKNSLIDEKRKAVRNETYTDTHEEADICIDPTDAIMVKELLHKLPPHLAHVVSLKYFGGLNATEIGRMKGVPPATVRSQLRAAISVMKKHMG